MAECIFSQSAPGEVYRAYFCKLAHILGWLVQIFAKTCAPCVDSSGLTKFPRNVAAAARRREREKWDISEHTYFRNHFPSRRRAYFRLASQLSQLCAQTLHIFAYYPRTAGAWGGVFSIIRGCRVYKNRMPIRSGLATRARKSARGGHGLPGRPHITPCTTHLSPSILVYPTTRV